MRRFFAWLPESQKQGCRSVCEQGPYPPPGGGAAGRGCADLLPIRKGKEATSEYVGKYLEAGLVSLTMLGQHLTELGSQRLHPVRFLDESGQARVLESLGNLLIAVSAGQNDAHVGLNAT